MQILNDYRALLLYWAFPALLMFLVVARLARDNGEPLQYWSGTEWAAIIVITVIYPIALVLVLYKNAGFLFDDIKLK